ncbi:hypothetical protein ACA910_002281 [Epithemia clementina (nom. ined.)]
MRWRFGANRRKKATAAAIGRAGSSSASPSSTAWSLSKPTKATAAASNEDSAIAIVEETQKEEEQDSAPLIENNSELSDCLLETANSKGSRYSLGMNRSLRFSPSPAPGMTTHTDFFLSQSQSLEMARTNSSLGTSVEVPSSSNKKNDPVSQYWVTRSPTPPTATHSEFFLAPTESHDTVMNQSFKLFESHDAVLNKSFAPSKSQDATVMSFAEEKRLAKQQKQNKDKQEEGEIQKQQQQQEQQQELQQQQQQQQQHHLNKQDDDNEINFVTVKPSMDHSLVSNSNQIAIDPSLQCGDLPMIDEARSFNISEKYGLTCGNSFLMMDDYAVLETAAAAASHAMTAARESFTRVTAESLSIENGVNEETAIGEETILDEGIETQVTDEEEEDSEGNEDQEESEEEEKENGEATTLPTATKSSSQTKENPSKTRDGEEQDVAKTSSSKQLNISRSRDVATSKSGDHGDHGKGAVEHDSKLEQGPLLAQSKSRLDEDTTSKENGDNREGIAMSKQMSRVLTELGLLSPVHGMTSQEERLLTEMISCAQSFEKIRLLVQDDEVNDRQSAEAILHTMTSKSQSICAPDKKLDPTLTEGTDPTMDVASTGGLYSSHLESEAASVKPEHGHDDGPMLERQAAVATPATEQETKSREKDIEADPEVSGGRKTLKKKNFFGLGWKRFNNKGASRRENTPKDASATLVLESEQGSNSNAVQSTSVEIAPGADMNPKHSQLTDEPVTWQASGTPIESKGNDKTASNPNNESTQMSSTRESVRQGKQATGEGMHPGETSPRAALVSEVSTTLQEAQTSEDGTKSLEVIMDFLQIHNELATATKPLKVNRCPSIANNESQDIAAISPKASKSYKSVAFDDNMDSPKHDANGGKEERAFLDTHLLNVCSSETGPLQQEVASAEIRKKQFEKISNAFHQYNHLLEQGQMHNDKNRISSSTSRESLKFVTAISRGSESAKPANPAVKEKESNQRADVMQQSSLSFEAEEFLKTIVVTAQRSSSKSTPALEASLRSQEESALPEPFNGSVRNQEPVATTSVKQPQTDPGTTLVEAPTAEDGTKSMEIIARKTKKYNRLRSKSRYLVGRRAGYLRKTHSSDDFIKRQLSLTMDDATQGNVVTRKESSSETDTKSDASENDSKTSLQASANSPKLKNNLPPKSNGPRSKIRFPVSNTKKKPNRKQVSRVVRGGKHTPKTKSPIWYSGAESKEAVRDDGKLADDAGVDEDPATVNESGNSSTENVDDDDRVDEERHAHKGHRNEQSSEREESPGEVATARRDSDKKRRQKYPQEGVKSAHSSERDIPPDQTTHSDGAPSSTMETLSSIAEDEDDSIVEDDYLMIDPKSCTVDYASSETWLAASDLLGLSACGGCDCKDDNLSQATPVDAAFFDDALDHAMGQVVSTPWWNEKKRRHRKPLRPS